MQQLSPLEYIKVDAANAYGLNKQTWDIRIDWFDTFYRKNKLNSALQNAKEPILMQKALQAHEDALNGVPTGYLCNLDATSSGLQILACLIGCHTTALATNLINTGNRENAYKLIANFMDMEEEICKQPTMTHFYNSKNQPKEVFGDKIDLFLEAINKILPGAEECRLDMQSCWRSDVIVNKWTLPDGHVAYVKNMVPVDKIIEIDELDHATFTHRIYENKAQDYSLSLPANITHSFDAYVVRQMYRMAKEQGFELLTIHDSFWASPNHMQKVRENYVSILADIANNNYLQPVLREITGNSKLEYIKRSNNLGNEILESDYAIC